MELVTAVPQGIPIEAVRKRDRRSFRKCFLVDESRVRLKDRGEFETSSLKTRFKSFSFAIRGGYRIV